MQADEQLLAEVAGLRGDVQFLTALIACGGVFRPPTAEALAQALLGLPAVLAKARQDAEAVRSLVPGQPETAGALPAVPASESAP